MTESKDAVRHDPIQGEILHEYDGILEADNMLPNWWLVTFFGTVLFSVGYYYYFHVYRVAPLSYEAFAQESAAAAAASGRPLTAAELEAMVQDERKVATGREAYMQNCVACHGDRLQGTIGPNLTDNAWIHGGAADRVYATIGDGVAAKGMPAWGALLGPMKAQAVTAFVLSHRNTNVQGGKEPQGEPYAP